MKKMRNPPHMSATCEAEISKVPLFYIMGGGGREPLGARRAIKGEWEKGKTLNSLYGILGRGYQDNGGYTRLSS